MRSTLSLPVWRREALRTTLWIVPTVLVVVVALLFAVTYGLDRAAYRGDLSLPSWINQDSADAGRQLLSAIAAAVITVVGVVFSITILSLTLASQQFGPRMLRNFIRDRGTQLTLGTFVATFVYALLALGSITTRNGRDFVPNLSITVALGLLLVDLAVLIYFIHHIAVSIQLPEVIAGISRDLSRAIEADFPAPVGAPDADVNDPGVGQLRLQLKTLGAPVAAVTSGYLQFVGYDELIRVAESTGSIVELLYRPGHFVTAGLPLARVWPPDAAPAVARALDGAHLIGPQRTLAQDPVFAIDQLVEIAIRALSPAVNDTFSALTCIDWLAAGLCQVSERLLPAGVRRDGNGEVRLIEPGPSYDRIVNRSYDKIRQAGRAMPAVAIRQMDSLAKVLRYTTNAGQRATLLRQAEIIASAGRSAIPDEADRLDLEARYLLVINLSAGLDRSVAAT